jgi:hypothetical protein
MVARGRDHDRLEDAAGRAFEGERLVEVERELASIANSDYGGGRGGGRGSMSQDAEAKRERKDRDRKDPDRSSELFPGR